MKIKPNQHIPQIIRFLITYLVQKYKPHDFSLLLPKMRCIWKIQLFDLSLVATCALYSRFFCRLLFLKSLAYFSEVFSRFFSQTFVSEKLAYFSESGTRKLNYFFVMGHIYQDMPTLTSNEKFGFFGFFSLYFILS